MQLAATYAIDASLSPTTLPTLDLRPFHLRPLVEEQRHDVLLDAADGAIGRQGAALWMSLVDGLATLVLTSAGQPPDAPENGSVQAPAPAFGIQERSQWPRQVAEPVAELVGDGALVPVIDLDIRRRAWSVEYRGNPVAVLLLDEGTIATPLRHEPLRELRIALKPGAERIVLSTLERRLRKLLPLAPVPRGALARELALLTVGKPVGGQVPLRKLVRRTLRRARKKLRKTAPAARAGRDPEDVHQVRTTLRRLRTVLQVLEEAPTEIEADRLRRLRRRLAPLARTLGEARDLDVLCQHVEAYTRGRPEMTAALRPLQARLGHMRAGAQQALRRELSRSRLRRHLKRLGRVATAYGRRDRQRPEILIRHCAGSMLWQRYESVLAYEEALSGAPPATLHQLRIACKQLRYTLELFEEALGPETAELLETVVAAQDHLGAMQDHVVALQRLAPMQREHSSKPAIAAYAASRAAEHDQLQEAFAPLWDALTDLTFRQRLSGLIARL